MGLFPLNFGTTFLGNHSDLDHDIWLMKAPAYCFHTKKPESQISKQLLRNKLSHFSRNSQKSVVWYIYSVNHWTEYF
jgi:hypothetical protein